MPKLLNGLPKYSLHRASGQAVVTIQGRDVYLGAHGSRESRTRYDRLVAEWLAVAEPQVLTVVDRLLAGRASRDPRHRHLVGFSKSGWGAIGLLLRHPRMFGRIVAWDAPFMMTEPQYGLSPIVGDAQAYDRVRIDRLLATHGSSLGVENRLVIQGYGNFRQHHVELHSLLQRLGIAHDYLDGPPRKHDWHSGWLAEGVAQLFRHAQANDARLTGDAQVVLPPASASMPQPAGSWPTGSSCVCQSPASPAARCFPRRRFVRR